MRFYFNIRSRECEIFEYGGCQGNANNFLTLEECQNKCVVTGQYPFSSSSISSSKHSSNSNPGICRGFFSRYFYNKETKKCELFMYGGCLGNRNNFRSLEECQATCQGNRKSSSSLLLCHKRQVLCMLWAEIFLQFLVESKGLIEHNSLKCWPSATGKHKRELERAIWILKYCVQEQAA
uniref:Tissue factor pathway inhibitor n=1 Tax=Coturnix japonica TaxID=93934 RepID=A0A8C2TS45_COTJA